MEVIHPPFRLFLFLVPLLFVSAIFSSSDILSVPHETDIDWDNWENPEISKRQSSTGTNQTCKCGTGISKLNVTKIVGGVSSRNHAWPWLAAIVDIRIPPTTAICGGSLISSWHILTAAHCLPTLKENGIQNYRVYLGGNRINGTNITDRVVAKIGALRAHPGYVSGEFNNDIGLIRLAAPVKFTKNINPICLSQKGDPFVGRNAIVAGWGVTTVGSLVGSNVLREVHVKVLSNAACKTTNPTLTPQMVCALTPKKDSCQGDSGGPLMVRKNSTAAAQIYTQIGIVSFGKGCGSATDPGVYTRISKYLPFIKANTKNSTLCSDSFT